MTMTPTRPTGSRPPASSASATAASRSQLEGRTLARIRGDKAHPASQGYTCNKAMRLDHYQNGRHRLTLAAAPARRRHVRGDRLGHRDRRGRRAASRAVRDEHGGDVDLLLRRRRPGQPPRRRLQRRAPARRSASRYRSSALAQEKMGEGWVDAQLYGGHTRGDFEHAEVVGLRRQEPVAVAELPARAGRAARDREGPASASMIVIDPVVTETAELADFHLRVRPGHATRGAWPRWRRARAGGPGRPTTFLAEHANGAEPVLAALRGGRRSPTTPQRCGVDEELIRAAARRIGDRRRASRSSRTSASSRGRTARSART